MSFILDALKKSETERQQQSSAEFSAVPTSPARPSVQRWIWLAGILLAINLAVLTGLLLKSNSPPSHAAVTFSEKVPDLTAVETPSSPSFEEQVAAARRTPPQKQDNKSVAAAGEEPREAIRPVLISQDPSAIPAADLYPSIQEYRASGATNLPELHLDIHVYSTEPEDRFVFINMTKLREGSQLAEGPVVTEITPNGVVLELQGQHFLLPRD